MRFPAPSDFADTRNCPFCDAATEAVDEVVLHPVQNPVQFARRILVLADNIRSAHNVGEVFRTADAAGVTHIHLCGFTATGDNPKVAKTALGAERTVAWTHHNNALDALDALVESKAATDADDSTGNPIVWALESTPTSVPLFGGGLPRQDPSTTGPPADDAARAATGPSAPDLLLVVGNETAGVDAAILERADRHVEIPMAGEKNSLNAAMALAVTLYWLRGQESTDG